MILMLYTLVSRRKVNRIRNWRSGLLILKTANMCIFFLIFCSHEGKSGFYYSILAGREINLVLLNLTFGPTFMYHFLAFALA